MASKQPVSFPVEVKYFRKARYHRTMTEALVRQNESYKMILRVSKEQESLVRCNLPPRLQSLWAVIWTHDQDVDGLIFVMYLIFSSYGWLCRNVVSGVFFW